MKTKKILVATLFVLTLVGCDSSNNSDKENESTSEIKSTQEEKKEDNTQTKDDINSSSEDIKSKDEENKDIESKDKKNQAVKEENISNEDLFNKLEKQDNINSYKLEITTKQINDVGSEKETINVSKGFVDYVKDPEMYHALYDLEDISFGKMETEYYKIDGKMFIRTGDSGWSRVEEDESNNYSDFNNDKLAKDLEKYYQVEEDDKYITLKLESTDKNVEDIRDIIYGDTGNQIFIGQIDLIKMIYKFDKKTLHPVSYQTQMDYETEENGKVSYQESSTYTKVNEIKEIEVSDEIKAMLNE